VPFAVFRLRTLRAANAIMLLTGAAVLSLFFILSLYEQQVLGYSATIASARTAQAIAAGTSDDVAMTSGIRLAFLAGAVFAALGMMAALALVPRRAEPAADSTAGISSDTKEAVR